MAEIQLLLMWLDDYLTRELNEAMEEGLERGRRLAKYGW